MNAVRGALVGLLLVAMCGGVAAQNTYPELYQDVTLLLTVRKLGLSTEQIRSVLGQAQALAAQRAELAQLRQTVWAEDGDSFKAVNEAWLKGKRTPARSSPPSPVMALPS